MTRQRYLRPNQNVARTINSPVGLMSQILAYQERGATLREIAAALRWPISAVHQVILAWLKERE